MQDAADQAMRIERPDRDQLAVVLSFLEDARRVIEGGKGRRWEVFKWAVSINVLLIPAALAHKNFRFPAVAFDISAIVISALALWIIHHYDRRISGARKRSHGLVRWIRANVIDISSVTGLAEDRDHPHQDRGEIFFFWAMIWLTGSAACVASCYVG